MTLSMTSIERKEEEGRRKENKKQNLRNAKMKLAHNTYIHSLTHTHRQGHMQCTLLLLLLCMRFL